MPFYTYQDAVESLVDYLGGSPSDVVARDCKRAIHDCYRDLVNAHNWSYLYRLGRVVTNASVSTGTVTYRHAGGAYPRTLTLSGAAWPAWVEFGFVRVEVANYRVARRVSDSVVTLDDELNPGVDLSTPSGFTAYQDTYLLPADYVSQDQALYERNFGGMTYTHPREWAYENRYKFATGTPQCFTVMSAPQAPGRLCLVIFPFPTEGRSIDFVYKRRPRPLTIYSTATGTISLSTGSSSVTGAGTAFDPSMVGSVIRVSANAKPPTSEAGSNPAAFESVVTAYNSPVSVVTADPSPSTLSAAPYVVSDPVDLELGAMLNAFKRGCEHQISMSRTLKDKPSARLQYADALNRARDADSRSFAGRREGQGMRFRQQMRDMPVGPDQT